ncbi:DUF6191 domain-containing protein [Actinocorallia herbida]|nr:DUF6191 domain-containing protein [Actinocorallia herbida]
MTGMLALLVVTSLPGLVLLLIVVAAVDRLGLRANERYRLPWRKPEDSRPVASAGLDEMQALFAPTKRYELDEKRSSLMLRDEEGDNAPPRTRVDLDGGKAVLHLP